MNHAIKQTDPQQPAPLEERYETTFPPPNEHLLRLFKIREELRARRERIVQTVVTYGAYEDPI